jgi:hypothetical protein
MTCTYITHIKYSNGAVWKSEISQVCVHYASKPKKHSENGGATNL